MGYAKEERRAIQGLEREEERSFLARRKRYAIERRAGKGWEILDEDDNVEALGDRFWTRRERGEAVRLVRHPSFRRPGRIWWTWRELRKSIDYGSE